MSTSILKLHNATIYQESEPILTDVNIDVQKGDFIYLIGKTGSGKSSLMKTLYADLQLKQGEGIIVDYDLRTLKESDIPFLRRKLGIVFQDFKLLPDRNVHKNLLFVLKATGWTNETEMNNRIEDVLNRVGMLQHLNKMPHQISGGEQQRVQLARVLAQLWQPQPTPAWLFLDEPTSALDLYHQQHTLRLLRTLTRQQPIAVCCVLHDLNLAALYADRILLLHQGQLVATGTPQEVLQADILTRWYQADLGVVYHPEVALPQVYLRQ